MVCSPVPHSHSSPHFFHIRCHRQSFLVEALNMPLIALEPLALALMAFSMPLSAASGSLVYGISGPSTSAPIKSATSDSGIAGINFQKLLDYDPVHAVKNAIKNLVGSFYSACCSTTSFIPRAAISAVSHLDVEVGFAVDGAVTHSTSNPATERTLGSPAISGSGAGDTADRVDEVPDGQISGASQVGQTVGAAAGQAGVAGAVGQVTSTAGGQASDAGQVASRSTASVHDTQDTNNLELTNEAVSQRDL